MKNALYYLYTILIICSYRCFVVSAYNQNECVEDNETCALHTYKVVKPLLDYLKQLQAKSLKVEYLEKEYNNTKNEMIAEYKSLISYLRSEIYVLKEESRQCQERLNQVNHTQSLMEQILKNIKDSSSKKGTPFTSCLNFIEESSNVHNISVPHMEPFEVLCENVSPLGRGWTVIQQRIKGDVDFDRDWASYRQGFGSFEGDFFLGLEKIHRLTYGHPHELAISLDKFDDLSTYYAHYDNFGIAGENDQYRVERLGIFLGTEDWNAFNEILNQKFTTYDRDNDGYHKNCATHFSGGWWYSKCGKCNLNGKFPLKKSFSVKNMHWFTQHSLKKSRMMIRPKMNY